MSSLVSIIIPVYNVGAYINKCLNSIANQDYKNFEAIIINDGSTDNTAFIAKEFIKKDSRFKLINQPNGGVSLARNNGLEIAKGEYITFIDGDDWVEPTYLSELLRLVKGNDLAKASFIFTDPDLNEKRELVYKNQSMSGIEATKSYLIGRNISSCVCGGIYKQEMLSELRFKVGERIGEDGQMTLNLLKRANSIAIGSALIYNVRVRAGSATRNGVNISNEYKIFDGNNTNDKLSNYYLAFKLRTLASSFIKIAADTTKETFNQCVNSVAYKDFKDAYSWNSIKLLPPSRKIMAILCNYPCICYLTVKILKQIKLIPLH